MCHLKFFKTFCLHIYKMCKIFPKFQLSLQKSCCQALCYSKFNTYTSFAKRYYFLSRSSIIGSHVIITCRNSSCSTQKWINPSIICKTILSEPFRRNYFVGIIQCRNASNILNHFETISSVSFNAEMHQIY